MATSLNVKELLGFKGAQKIDVIDDTARDAAIKTETFSRYNSQAKQLPTFLDSSEKFALGGDASQAVKGRASVLHEIKNSLKSHDVLKDSIEDGLADLGEGGSKNATRSLERMLDKRSRDLKGTAQKLYSVTDDLMRKHGRAKQYLVEEFSEIKSKFIEEHTKAVDFINANKGKSGVKLNGTTLDLADDAKVEGALESVKNNYNDAMNKVEDVYKNRLELHNDSLDQFKRLRSDVAEKTGIQPKALSTVEEAAAKTASTMEHNVAPVAEGSSMLKKGFGIGLMGAGGLGLANAAMDPDKGIMSGQGIISGAATAAGAFLTFANSQTKNAAAVVRGVTDAAAHGAIR